MKLLLPEDFVSEWVEKAEGCSMFGFPLQDLSREELLATAAFASAELSSARESAARAFNLQRDLYKAARG